MYESNTYDAVLARMLSKVPDIIDKREGSIIYDALGPVAVELAQAYIEMDVIMNNFSLDSATGDYLTELCSQYGVIRKEAIKSQRRGVFNTEVPVGSRFYLEDTSFIVLSNINGFEYLLECEQAGVTGNDYTGQMIPVDYIDSLNLANLTDIIKSGTEEEIDDDLRVRMKQYLTNPIQDGNTAQYMQWAVSYGGIGKAKVFPLWNGGNTVKIAITNRQYLPAESYLVEEFQNYIDPGVKGLGNGVAPIGSKVTVTGGTKKNINITANVILTEGYTEPEHASSFITDYLASITYVKNTVSYMRIGSTLLDCPSIAEIAKLTVNAGTADVNLEGDEIPVLHNFSLVVTS